MAHFAELDENNVVINVIVVNDCDCHDDNGIENEEIGCENLCKMHGENKIWKQTSYNNNIRHRYAYIGGTYSPEYDVFLLPKPYPSWVLNTDNYNWEAPIGMPSDWYENDSNYLWDEDNQVWKIWNSDTESWSIVNLENT